MRSQPLEKDLEKKCVTFAEFHGWEHIKLDQGRNKRGWPDGLFLGPDGAHFFVEFKRLGLKPRKQQQARIVRLRELDHDVLVVDAFEHFQTLFLRQARPDRPALE